MEKEKFSFYRDWQKSLQGLPDEQKLELYNAIVEYGLDGVESAVSPIVHMAMNFIKSQIDRNDERIKQRNEKLRENGKFGGRPKKNQMVSEKPNGFSENQKNQMVSEKPNGTNVNINTNIDVNMDKPYIEAKASLSAKADDEVESEDINYQGLVDYYNFFSQKTNLIRCIKLTNKRKQAIRARIKEFGKENVAIAIQKAAKSSFLNGHNDRNWRADIDFVFNASKMARILEGKYDNQQTDFNGSGLTENNIAIRRDKLQRQSDAITRINRLLAEGDEAIASRQKEAAGELQPGHSEEDLFK